MRKEPAARLLVDAAASRYRAAGRVHQGFVRGKLRHDPVYLSLLAGGMLPSGGTLVDLGCGRGVLLAALVAAGDPAVRSAWPAEWASPPERFDLIGIEVSRRAASAARIALSREARIEIADLAVAPIPDCRAAVILDVLHYLPGEAQERLLDRVAAAVEPGGILIVREVDASGGIADATTRIAERLMALARGDRRRRFRFRTGEEWRCLLEFRGFTVEATRMDEGTPFSNLLLRARLDPSATMMGSRRRGNGALDGGLPTP